MDNALIELAAANIAFVGMHFVMSHPLRAPIVRAVGEKLFPAIYSLVSLVLFVWIILAFRAAPSADLPGTGEVGWIIASIIMIPAVVLYSGSMRGNPALPMPDAAKAAQAEPAGVFAVTRHPMMWSFALWALSHLVLYWSWRTMITAFAMGLLALVGAHMQDRKKRVLMGDDWAGWESKTSYWPRWGKLVGVHPALWLIAIGLWLLLSWLHLPIGGIPAGIWRWF